MMFKNYVGIDISKNTLDIALMTSEGELVEVNCLNDRVILNKCLNTLLKDYKIKKEETLVCAEHTGHFGNKLIDICENNQFNLWMESAYTIIQSQGLTRGKNDKVDAIRIAEYARRFEDKVVLWEAEHVDLTLLKRLYSERELIVKDIAEYKSQLKQEEGFHTQTYFKQKKKRILKLMKYNDNVLQEIEKEIDIILISNAEIKNNFEIITSISGVGKQTALITIISTSNFTKFENPRQFACHAGCAPFKYESGTSRTSKNKVSNRANKDIKKIFHMAALSSLRTKGEMRQYFDRKVAEGKNKMTVINAIRSKLIHRIFVLVKENRKYDKNYIHSLA